MANRLETAPSVRAHIRWMIRRDMPAMMAAERLGRDDRWDEDRYLAVLREKNAIGMVAEMGGDVVAGGMLYELHRSHIHLARFVVHPGWRRRGVGRLLVARLKSKLSLHRRTSITAMAPESYGYEGPLFLRACGFVATGVVRDGYGPGIDGIAFTYHHGWDGEVEDR